MAAFGYWRGVALVAAIFLAILLFVPAWFDLFEVLQMTQYVVLAIYALSLAYIWGFGGIISFGQAGFFGLGGYAFAVISINMGDTTVPFLLTIALCLPSRPCSAISCSTGASATSISAS